MPGSPLTADEQNAIHAVYKTIISQSAQFVSRRQQRALIAMVARVAAEGDIGLCEAPTAVGKSLGYLIPVMTLAALRQSRAIVTTATVVLQDQLISRDAPRVQRAIASALSVSVPVAVLKGRSRYVCPVLLEARTAQSDLFTDPDANRDLHRLSEHLADGSWDGDLDGAPVKLARTAAREIANDRHQCVGRACSQHDTCPYVKAVSECRAARVIVTNHDMLLRMMETQDVATLPPLNEATIVFDEAHHLPDKAIDALAARFETRQRWFDAAIERYGREDAGKADTIRRYLATANRAVARAERELERAATQGSRVVHIDDALQQAIEPHLRETLQGYKAVSQAMETYNTAMRDSKARRRLALREIVNMGDNNRVRGITDALDTYLEDEDPTLPVARWAERVADGWVFCRTPFEPGRVLRRRLWDKVHAAIAVSATLAPSSGFGPTLHRFGLLANKRVKTLSLDSPLDYSRSRIVIPRLTATPSQSEAHTRDVVATILQLDRDAGGVLVLFSSRRQMKAAADALKFALGDALLVQGDGPVASLLARHAERINSGLPSVLMGMQSFGEGLDLPGKLCVAVVIDKIPFPAADDPVLKAAADHLRASGREPFGLLILPAASITLKQNVGRLVRGPGDGGTVYLLDSRARTQSYGKQLLAGLPMAVEFG